MDVPETGEEKAERYRRLLARLISHAEAGEAAAPLREQLDVAMMMSPLSATEQMAALAAFDAAVAKLPGNRL